MTSREFDVVLFGATGVTGVYVVEELYTTARAEHFKWAIAGRSETKLKETLRAAATNLQLQEDALDKITTIVADVEDEVSITEMVRRTRILLNTVGPYRFFGRPVVKACVHEGTHHLDVSGEPQYLEQMQNEFFKEAEEKGIFVIGACGFDSIPAEMTLTYLRNNFKGELGQVETFVAMTPGPQGMKINFGTWQSAIHGMAHASELVQLRKEAREKIFTKSLPPCEARLTRRNALFWSDIAKGWCLPFLGSDRSVLLHSEMFRYQLQGKRPAQIQTYIRVPSFLHGIGMILLAAIFGIMSSFAVGRKLLEKFPGFFSAGLVRRGGPTREQAMACSFTLVAKGKGWEEKLCEATDKHRSPPEKSLVVSLQGPDPAYVTTATCLVQTAMVILSEKDKMLGKGGVLSPGAALSETSYLDRLQKNGFKFQVL